jgi:hypothetical protein
MNLRNNPRPWVILCMLFCISVIRPVISAAQCGANPVKSVAYTATLTGVGNNTYTVNSLPQFPATTGTLISAVVKSNNTATSTLVLTNTVASPQDIFPSFSRSDIIKLNGTTLGAPGGAGFSGYPETMLNPAGSAGDNATLPTQTVLNNAQDYYDSVKNSNPVFTSFQGVGNLSFTYRSVTFPGGIPTGVNSNYNINETITFAVTYYYCAIVLSTNILTFTATRADDHTVHLNWMSSNEEAGSRYEVEVSMDGTNFSTFDSRQAIANHLDASYGDSYTIPPGTTGRLYFRLKMVNADGTLNYSPVRIVDLDGAAATGFHIFPDPPDAGFVNVVFGTPGSDWQVDIFSASGSLLQRNYFYNSATARVDFRNSLSSGAYFLRATDQQTGRNYTASFLIRK